MGIQVRKKLKNVGATMERVIPDDIIIDILLRLPVTSILLCMFVCKRWLSLIRSQNFIRLHLNRPVNNHIQDPMLVVCATRYPCCVFNLLPDNYYVALDHLFPSRVLEGSLTFVLLMGPCNGLFCITNLIDIFLFNPAIEKSKQLPHSPFQRSGDSTRLYDDFDFDCSGFGVDPISNDYVVITFNGDGVQDDDNNDYYYSYDCGAGDEDRYGDDKHDNHSHDLHLEVQIYSLRTNSWRELDCVLPSVPIHKVHCDGLFLNGAFHWLGYRDWCHIGFIVLFDLSNGDFKWFELPNCYFVKNGFLVYLSILNESLAVIEHSVFSHWNMDPEFEIWVMAEYGDHKSWMKMYQINHDLGFDRPLSFTKEKEFLVQKSDGQLVSFNLETRVVKELRVHGVPRSMHAFRYRESLVSLQ